MNICKLCPRECGIDRSAGQLGYCGEGNELRVARIAPHYFEEPCISGTRGSGTVFFTGCSLHCEFCQNKSISHSNTSAYRMSNNELYEAILTLADSGVHNINLVTPTHFLHRLIPVLERLKRSGELKIPIVYNSSGYESLESLKRLDGLIDIYLPDLKYFSSELSERYSHAPDYFDRAIAAITEMVRQRGKYIYSGELLQSGVIVRHLVLPNARKDSIALLEALAQTIGTEKILISLMSQYTPDFAMDSQFAELHRRVTSFEYSSVLDATQRLGFDGFMQSKDSANAKYTPEFK